MVFEHTQICRHDIVEKKRDKRNKVESVQVDHSDACVQMDLGVVDHGPVHNHSYQVGENAKLEEKVVNRPNVALGRRLSWIFGDTE